MDKQYTVVEVIQMTINHLEDIPVPRKLNGQIGIPIDQAIENLKACIEAMHAAAETKPENDQISPETEESDSGNK